MKDWIQGIKNRERRAIARVITFLENNHSDAEFLIQELERLEKKAYVIGITGPPGAGKSTLIDCLITTLRAKGLRVGVIVVDPTSPFTGGAILGDRVRMVRHALDEGVFIRSMGSRGSLGGLSRATKDAVRVLDAAGFDVIIVETVGVGQSELEIMHLVDSVALVVHPHSGDVVQVFKAGVMEIADLYVVNKADISGAVKMVAEIEQYVHVTHDHSEWSPTVSQTIPIQGKGIVELWEQFQHHRVFLQESGEGIRRRKEQTVREIKERIDAEFQAYLQQCTQEPAFQEQMNEVWHGKKLPHQFAREWVKSHLIRQDREGM
ncbi:LAO/AO transport system kinase [Thermoactinomyces sp. DSM 45891]|uniref:methylmalonyl Co-A mutase-associated GTPase MeaB n=1 Tax=Thermoactinomyces sp. DSM 45891 TaxID=1761907 RepID=UPI00091AE0F3|nr:methylmalonyl Co-A mutase-associated GTPase MeaB [Thermoactinomyces sp. DSM 45891]SFX62223.1 LAO/AO transport system kinase [Thermoactinomyces sp. DSM 45891]